MKFKIYKFGGASIKDAKSIKNISNILNIIGYKKIFMIISAIGNTTNSLENIIELYFLKKNEEVNILIKNIINNHLEIINNLFPIDHNIFKIINIFFENLQNFLEKNKSIEYNFVYDQIVSYGELISTKIISEYLNLISIQNIWIDVRNYIKTDSLYREANVDWGKTSNNISTFFNKRNNFYITQGFLGSNSNNFTTTLGREGSDYTASIFSYCLDAKEQIIWKDVPGVLNADPRYFNNVKCLSYISYEEAIQLSYYGASIIHPKTLHPLQKKKIPLYIRSFLDLKHNGTIVSDNNPPIVPLLPCYTVKKNQILLDFSKKDNSFFKEENISELFKNFAKYFIKINLIQNSAINFLFCIDDKFNNLNFLLKKLNFKYQIKITKELFLYTIRHYNEKVMKKFIKGKIILLQQYTANTAQWIVKK